MFPTSHPIFLFLSFIIYIALLAISLNLIENNPNSTWRYIVALLPMIPGVVIALGVVRAIIQMDELEQNWSQAKLAHHLGTSRQTVNAIERGKYDPSLPLSFKIAALFGKLIEEVFEPDESDARWKPHTMSIPILSIVGRSGSGKTTLLEKIIVELKRRGYRLATVKHHAHSGFEIDQPGKDTWRHAQAGSDLVIIAAPDKIASIRKLEQELTLDEIAAGIDGVDIILTEGYKRAGKPALEVVRAEVSTKPICNPDQLVALVTDTELDTDVPQFHLQDVNQIVDFIISQSNIG